MSKKTETLEVRISPELKAELSAEAKRRGQAMSEVIRDLVHTEVHGIVTNANDPEVFVMKKSTLNPALLAGVTLLALGVVASIGQNGTAIAQSSARATFAALDRDNNGVVDREEFNAFDREVEEEVVQLPAACEDDFGGIAGPGNTEIQETAATDDFREFDRNADGKVVFGEVQHLLSRERIATFVAIDKDQDGFLTADEFSEGEAVSLSIESDQEISQSCREALAVQVPIPLVESEQSDRIAFAVLDANRDKRLSLTEYLED